MNWFLLILAGLLEIGWAISMKYTNGFTKLWPTAITFALMTISFYLMSIALKTIPFGTCYAVWTGIGAAGAATVGILFFNEPREVSRIICLLMIVSGTVGLKMFSKAV